MSAKEIDALITTAASAGCGRFLNRPGRNTIINAISRAPTTPVSCVFAPERSATAVRDPLVLIGKPWNSPAAMFAAPMPVISRSPRISCPVRAANDVAVEIVSASETIAIAAAPITSGPTSDSLIEGTVNGGNPFGRTPTRSTPWSWSENTVVATIAPTTITSTAGTFGSHRCNSRIKAIPETPSTAAAGTTLPSATPETNFRSSSMNPSASTLNPHSFGSWPTTIVRARPFMYPMTVGFDSRSAMNPRWAIPATTRMTPTMSASIDDSAIARAGSPPLAMSGAIVTAIIGPSDESGPSTRMRDGPNTA